MKTVLVVEDDLLIQDVIAFDLKIAGYQVIVAANADEAIAILEARDDVRLVFTDVRMPGSMDGVKLAASIRDRWPPIHIIVTSGNERPAALPVVRFKTLRRRHGRCFNTVVQWDVRGCSQRAGAVARMAAI